VAPGASPSSAAGAAAPSDAGSFPRPWRRWGRSRGSSGRPSMPLPPCPSAHRQRRYG